MAEEMRLEKELTIAAPLEQTWRVFTELDLFTSCLPDAELRATDGAYTGRVKLGSDANPVVCEAAVRSLDQDEDEHMATILLHARQLDGPAIGSVTLHSRCQTADSSTRVLLSAEVAASGHAGGDAFQRGAHEVLDRVGARIEQEAVAVPPPAPTRLEVPTPPAPQAERAPALARPGPERGLAMVAAGVLLIVLLRWLLGRRR